jgi:alpha-D-ribose 1-methylphosphonate 5-triphosphate synthase subunit PhnG
MYEMSSCIVLEAGNQVSEPQTEKRRAMMGLLARTAPDRLATRFATLGPEPEYVWLRPPETGTVMLRGRIGGTGALFNIGEMTVTRCVLQVGSGQIGHAHVQGRDKAHARRAALVDALWQGDPQAIETAILGPLRVQAEKDRRATAERAAATRVDFFTLVRGEDA